MNKKTKKEELTNWEIIKNDPFAQFVIILNCIVLVIALCLLLPEIL